MFHPVERSASCGSPINKSLRLKVVERLEISLWGSLFESQIKRPLGRIRRKRFAQSTGSRPAHVQSPKISIYHPSSLLDRRIGSVDHAQATRSPHTNTDQQ